MPVGPCPRPPPLIPDLLDSFSMDNANVCDAQLSKPILSNKSDWQSDWSPWLQHIEGFARLGNVWDYVDPDGSSQLQAPIRPDPPTPPSIDPWSKRQRQETEQDFLVRVAEYRLKLDLLGQEYAVRQEQYRVECLEYSIQLGEYATAKEHMNQVNRIIFSTVDDNLSSHLNGKTASTPRLKLKSLRSLIRGTVSQSSDSPRAVKSQIHKLMDKLRCKGPRDWVVWAYDVNSLSENCDELARSLIYERMANESFLDSLQPYWKGFCQRWQRKMEDPTSNGTRQPRFKELLDDFVHAQLDSAVPSEPNTPSVHTNRKADHADSASLSDQSNQALTPKNKRCPGCFGLHPLTGNVWWESCWVFDEFMGRHTAPKWFKVREDKLDCVKKWFLKYPQDEKLARGWDSTR